MRLGKEEYVHDERTLMLGNFVTPTIVIPTSFDFDHGRASFPARVWGNNEWGDCVLAGRANHLLRIERVEQRRTIKLYDSDVVNFYKEMTGSKNPGDVFDHGLVVIEAMRQWRNIGWTLGTKNQRTYQISAYGELDPADRLQLRTAIYALHGIHLGFWLPRAAQTMTSAGLWDYNGENGPQWRAGSWGGHLVYAKRYDPDSIYVYTWGQEIRVTNSFIEQYCDEAWAVADALDTWRARATLDVVALRAALQQITTKVDG